MQLRIYLRTPCSFDALLKVIEIIQEELNDFEVEQVYALLSNQIIFTLKKKEIQEEVDV